MPKLTRKNSLAIFIAVSALAVVSVFTSKDNRTAGERIDDTKNIPGVVPYAGPSAPASANVPTPIPPAREPSPAELRNNLADEYLKLISLANPHLNFIKQKTTKIKGGYALWAVHEYFTANTFSIGDDAKLVQAWIARSRPELYRAGITRVGLQSARSYGSCYFDLN